jgi:hypothetical protein
MFPALKRFFDWLWFIDNQKRMVIHSTHFRHYPISIQTAWLIRQHSNQMNRITLNRSTFPYCMCKTTCMKPNQHTCCLGRVYFILLSSICKIYLLNIIQWYPSNSGYSEKHLSFQEMTSTICISHQSHLLEFSKFTKPFARQNCSWAIEIIRKYDQTVVLAIWIYILLEFWIPNGAISSKCDVLSNTFTGISNKSYFFLSDAHPSSHLTTLRPL